MGGRLNISLRLKIIFSLTALMTLLVVVVYMGDDERGEFLYRYISKDKYHPDRDNSNLLEYGRLYVAKFHDDLRGQWLPPFSPGCWIPTNTDFLSLLQAIPVTSHSLGPTKKRLISPVLGSAISIWLFPIPVKSPSLL